MPTPVEIAGLVLGAVGCISPLGDAIAFVREQSGNFHRNPQSILDFARAANITFAELDGRAVIWPRMAS
jgi:hypothetical protein